jgi:hypothetical protein
VDVDILTSGIAMEKILQAITFRERFPSGAPWRKIGSGDVALPYVNYAFAHDVRDGILGGHSCARTNLALRDLSRGLGVYDCIPELTK